MDVLNTCRATVSMHNLISNGDRILIGLSGGADSVALFHIMLELSKEYNLTLAAAHINHRLRDTADRDMEFCRSLCDKYSIDFFCKTVDIKSESKKRGMSDELYARQVRYDFFDSLNYDKIATAHNKNDVAETMLFHFIRGAATGGLTGIPYMRKNIIRPILDVKKADIISFCKENGYEYMTDETNLEPIYSRNKIRLNLIPEIEKTLNPSFVDVVTKNAALIHEDSDYLDDIAIKSYSGEILIDKFMSLPIPIKRRVLQLHFKKSTKSYENLASNYINSILELIDSAKSGSKIDLPKNFEAKIIYNSLLIEEKHEKVAFEYEIEPDKILHIPEINKQIVIKSSKKGNIFLENTSNLTIRSRRNGDVFYPTGMTGKKRLSDFFSDKKVPLPNRNFIPLLTKNGEIASVIGMRCDRRFYDKEKNNYEIIIKEV